MGDRRPGSTEPLAGPPSPEPPDPELSSASNDHPHDRPDAAWRFLRELGILTISALVIAVIIKTFLVQAFYIPSGSMIPPW